MKTRSQKQTKDIVKLTVPICNVHFHRVFTVNIFATWHFTRCFCNRSYRVMFFDFLIPLSAKTPSFESISGRPSSKKALTNRCFRWEGYEKVEQNIAPEWGPSNICCKNTYKMRDLELIRQSRGFPGFRQNDVAARCSEPPFLTHGGQDDGSYTNSLKLYRAV